MDACALKGMIEEVIIKAKLYDLILKKDPSKFKEISLKYTYLQKDLDFYEKEIDLI